MGWMFVPVYGSQYSWPDLIMRAAWQEVVDAINERSQFLGLGDIAADVIDSTPTHTRGPTQLTTGLSTSLLDRLRANIETLAPHFRNGYWGGDGSAWTVSALLSRATGSSGWSAVRGGSIVEARHINDLYSCLQLLAWRAISPKGAEVLQRAHGSGGSNASWDASWDAAEANYDNMAESGDDDDQLSGYYEIVGAIRGVNTDAAGKLYLQVTEVSAGDPPTLRVDIFKDLAKTNKVAHTADYTTAGSKSLIEDNSSGIDGYITVDDVVGADALITITRLKSSTGHLVGMLGEAHSPGGGLTYQHEITQWYTRKVEFDIPSAVITGTKYRWKGNWEGRTVDWAIYEGEDFGGAEIYTSYLLTGWNLTFLSTVTGGTTAKYSLRADDEDRSAGYFRPSDGDGNTHGSYIDDHELLVEIGFEFLD